MYLLSIILESQSILFSLVLIFYMAADHLTNSYVMKAYIRILSTTILLLLCDILLIINELPPASLKLALPQLVCLTMKFLQPLLLAQMSSVVFRQIRSANENFPKTWNLVIHALCAVNTALVILTPKFHLLCWYDEEGIYQRGIFYDVPMVIGCIGILIMVACLFSSFNHMKKTQIYSHSALLLFPFIGMVLQYFTKQDHFAAMGLAASVLMFIFVTLYQFRRELLMQRNIILQDRIYLLDTQIKPHFIFNSLTTIRAMIYDDPEGAEEAINHFTKYLRKDLNFERGNKPTSIQDELELIENYLYMQKLRFPDILQVEYEIDDSLEFDLPFLSIQPLVENAIKHGIRQKEGGGTVTIRVYQDASYNIVEVEDTGAGFDVKEVKAMQKKRSEELGDYSIGLKNVKERLATMCNGTLSYKTKIGEGTTATIRIPK